MTINSKTGLQRTVSGMLAIQQPKINGWETSYNPDTNSFCAHNAAGDIVRSFSVTDKRGILSRRGWDNLKYWCRKNNPQ